MAWDDGQEAEFENPYNSNAGDDSFGGSFGGGDFHDDFGDQGGESRGGGCFNCGREGHNKADCTMPRSFSGQCNSCGKEGHTSRVCPDACPVVCRRCKKKGHFTKDCDMPLVCPRCGGSHFVSECSMPMTCHLCQAEGHLARDCPSAPPRVCMNCQEEGHDASTCTVPRKINRDDVPQHEPEEALDLLRKAIAEKDFDDAKAAVQMYVKALPETTYVDMEKVLRENDIKLFLIGIEKTEMAPTLTNMDFQGNLDKKFTVTYRFQDSPSRPRERAMWPSNAEENMARLADGGEPVPRGITFCYNCREIGHMRRNCPMEKREDLDKPRVTCYNCGEDGHRIRDCKVPRTDKYACRNCGQSGHNSKDCTEPRSAENVECRKCGKTGHFARDCPDGGGNDRGCRNCGQEGHVARDCPEPRNMDKVQCHNCDEYGHMSRDCPLPRNIDRVKCTNCQQMGHFQSNCKAGNVAEDDGFAGGSGFGDGDFTADSGLGDGDFTADGGLGENGGGFDYEYDNGVTAGAVEDTDAAGGGVW